jgi:parvulin-like peptidyl-prolyl isomerase
VAYFFTMNLKQLSLLPLTLSLSLASLSLSAQVLSTWDDKSITIQDIESELLKQLTPERDKYRYNPRHVSQLAENLMIYRELTARAKAEKLDADPLVKRLMENAVERALGGYYLEQLVEAHVRQLPNFDSAVQERYEVDKAKYAEKASVGLAHLLYRPKNGDNDAAEAKAQAALTKLNAGTPFHELVNESEDPSANKNGGFLGNIERGKLIKPMEDKAFSMKVGERAVLKTQFGVHVLELRSINPERQKPLSEVRADIAGDIVEKVVADFRLRYLSDIKNNKTIKVDEATFLKYTEAVKLPPKRD